MGTRRSTRNLNDEQSEPEANELLSAICLKLDNINDSLQLIIKNQQNDQNSKENQYGVIASSIQDIQNNLSISMKKFAEAESKAAIFRSRKRAQPKQQQYRGHLRNMAQQRETNCAKEIPDERNTQRRPK